MRNLSRSESMGLIVLLTAITGVVGVAVWRGGVWTASPGITLRESFPQAPAAPPPAHPPDPTSPTSVPPPASAAQASETGPPAQIVVHVAGAVRTPGVYHLPAGARGDDALKAAGGPTEEANTDSVNLAARVEDGTQLYIRTRKEQPTGGASSEPTTTETRTDGSSAAGVGSTKTGSTKKGGSSATHAPSRSGNKGDKGGKPGKLSAPGEGQININTADAEQLQRIPGIGPAMAERILTFRKENQGFKSVEDLLQVSGIGAKKFERMQPYVRVK